MKVEKPLQRYDALFEDKITEILSFKQQRIVFLQQKIKAQDRFKL
jgi:5'(3')-deoxyribonucleotidase